MLLRERPGSEPKVVWFYGLSGAGKTTLADALSLRLRRQGVHVARLDGDELRGGLCADLGFDRGGRAENLRRAACVARLMSDAGTTVVGSFVTPFESDRARIREIVGERMLQIFVDAGLAECERRDPKGLYRKARTGELAHFTGVSSPFEAPTAPDLVLSTEGASVADLIELTLERLRRPEPEYAI